MNNFANILDKFAVYSEYNSNQTSFNLLSTNYALHNIGKTIEKLLKEYDSTGVLAVIYAKICFKAI